MMLCAFRFLFTIMFLIGCAARVQAAMEIQGIVNGTAPASNYDRFDNSSAWIGNPANWAGGALGKPVDLQCQGLFIFAA